MNYFKVASIQPNLNNLGELIKIEIDISKGFHSFNIVGMTDRSIKEAKDRVSSAIKNSGYGPPKQFNNKITVSLSPASIKKEGSLFDLPIAIAYLATKNIIKTNIEDAIFIGELNLNGELIKTKGVFLAVLKAKESHYKKIIIPKANYSTIYKNIDIEIIPVSSLNECVEYLNTNILKTSEQLTEIVKNKDPDSEKMFSKIIGNEFAKRALIISLTGKHHMALWGRSGSGKTTLARSSIELLPEPNYQESLEILKINSINNLEDEKIKIPFISPHHSASYASIIGGANNIGAITLAHNGILFLDEFLEFESRSIESLRQPMEDKYIEINRSSFNFKYPSDFILIAGMNPCKCGFYGSRDRTCTCDSKTLNEYKNKISGPISNRISIWVEMNDINNEKIIQCKSSNEISTDDIKHKIYSARIRLRKEISLNENSKKIILDASQIFNMSTREIKNIISVSKTIAALENSIEIKTPHILEALQYRKNINKFN